MERPRVKGNTEQLTVSTPKAAPALSTLGQHVALRKTQVADRRCCRGRQGRNLFSHTLSGWKAQG
jgi:hypothetical protein